VAEFDRGKTRLIDYPGMAIDARFYGLGALLFMDHGPLPALLTHALSATFLGERRTGAGASWVPNRARHTQGALQCPFPLLDQARKHNRPQR
jgi:hypothetical protein